MNYPSVSVIIAVYKDVEAIQRVINSLLTQTHIPDEIIITEDGENEAMKAYIASLNHEHIKHITQEDLGWRKNRALNRAIAISKSDYLIFIDGDCVPYPTFIESHCKLAEENHALCGRRTEPGNSFSQKLRSGSFSIDEFVNNYVLNYFALQKDNVRHYDEGLYFSPNSLIFRLIHKFARKNTHIVGCNWSCFKNELIKINGFDEDFIMPTNGEDTDVERRLRHFGVKMKSCRNAANVIHLYHEKIFNPEISQQTETLMETKKSQFICENGLNQHNKEIQ